MIYTLTSVEQADRYTTEHGQFQAWEVGIEEDGTAKTAQLSTKIQQDGTTKGPVVGEEIDGTISASAKGLKLKKNFQNAGASPRSGGGNWSPKKEKEVTQQAMLKVAAEFLKIRSATNPDEPVTNDLLWNHATLLREKVEAL